MRDATNRTAPDVALMEANLQVTPDQRNAMLTAIQAAFDASPTWAEAHLMNAIDYMCQAEAPTHKPQSGGTAPTDAPHNATPDEDIHDAK